MSDPLLERDRELDAIDASLVDAAAGRGCSSAASLPACASAAFRSPPPARAGGRRLRPRLLLRLRTLQILDGSVV